MTAEINRCRWCTTDADYIAYHDHEWGVPNRDPHYLFEMLLLEGFQAGLSWITVLKKRARYREVFHGFVPEKVAAMTDDDLEALMQDPGIIRNRLKLKAARQNARAWLAQPDPVGLVWSFTGGQPIVHHYEHHDSVPTTTPQAEQMSRTLKKAGFKFVGPTICQSYLQAVGCFMDHTANCFRHGYLANAA